MAELTIEQLTEAVAGGAVALRSGMELQPADGPGGKVFPPTYAGAGGHKYAIEERQVGDRLVTTVLLDSVASQANRAELALLEGWEAGELSFPVPFVDFTGEADLDDLGRITVLEAPHRLADAIFRDSLLEGTLFRLSEMGRAITGARPGNATDLFRYAPTTLLFGQWDSTGPKGGLGSKFQRAYVSEIVGLDAHIGRKVRSRIDPLQIERGAAVVYEHSDPQQRWTLDREEAVQEKGKPKPVGGDGRPSEINHGNIAPSMDSQAGGVTASSRAITNSGSTPSARRPGTRRRQRVQSALLGDLAGPHDRGAVHTPMVRALRDGHLTREHLHERLVLLHRRQPPPPTAASRGVRYAPRASRYQSSDAPFAAPCSHPDAA